MVNVRRSSATTNPFNAGLVATAATDQLSIDGQVTGLFSQGRSSLALQLRHLQSPLMAADDAPTLYENGALATLMLGMGQPLAVAFSANTTIRSGEAYEALSMPKTDYADFGGSHAAQQVRTFSLSEMGSFNARWTARTRSPTRPR
jgi:hypothetical protein